MLTIALLITCLFVPPPQVEKPTPVPPVVPNFSGRCQFGTIYQDGLNVTVDGGNWTAVGLWRKDHVYLLWSHPDWPAPCPAAYKLEFGKLVGAWVATGEGTINEAGEVIGNGREETLYVERK